MVIENCILQEQYLVSKQFCGKKAEATLIYHSWKIHINWYKEALSYGTLVYSTHNTDCNNITKILLKVVLIVLYVWMIYGKTTLAK